MKMFLNIYISHVFIFLTLMLSATTATRILSSAKQLCTVHGKAAAVCWYSTHEASSSWKAALAAALQRKDWSLVETTVTTITWHSRWSALRTTLDLIYYYLKKKKSSSCKLVKCPHKLKTVKHFYTYGGICSPPTHKICPCTHTNKVATLTFLCPCDNGDYISFCHLGVEKRENECFHILFWKSEKVPQLFIYKSVCLLASSVNLWDKVS